MKTDSIFPSRFLRAADLQGRRAAVIIDEVIMQDIGDDNKPVARFKNKSKALVLNKTNLRSIEEITGTDETDNWRGARITLYPTRVDYQGRRVDAIRIDRPSNDGNGEGDGGGRGGEQDGGKF